jgi:hypothetical protein
MGKGSSTENLLGSLFGISLVMADGPGVPHSRDIPSKAQMESLHGACQRSGNIAKFVASLSLLSSKNLSSFDASRRRYPREGVCYKRVCRFFMAKKTTSERVEGREDGASR